VAGERESLTFVLSGLSKLAALPQLKLGFGVLCGPAWRVAAASDRLAIIADTFLSVATPVQRALPRIFEESAEMRARILARTGANLAALRAALAGGAASVLDVEAGWSAIVRLPRLAQGDDEAWTLALLERAGVLVHPGGLYDLDGCHIVVSLLGPEPDLARGVEALADEVASRIAEA
jgi:hypothetical protein